MPAVSSEHTAPPSAAYAARQADPACGLDSPYACKYVAVGQLKERSEGVANATR